LGGVGLVEVGEEVEECGGVDGFDHVVVEAGVFGALFVGVLSPAGDGDEGDGGGPGVLAEGADEVVAVDFGEADVEECDVGAEVFDGDESVGAVVGDADVVAGHSEEHGEGVGGVAVVVDDDDAEGGRGGG